MMMMKMKNYKRLNEEEEYVCVFGAVKLEDGRELKEDKCRKKERRFKGRKGIEMNEWERNEWMNHVMNLVVQQVNVVLLPLLRVVQLTDRNGTTAVDWKRGGRETDEGWGVEGE